MVKNQTATNILFEGFPSFGFQIGHLLGVPLIHILHDGVRTTFRGNPNMLGSLFINQLKDPPNPRISSHITLIPVCAPYSGSLGTHCLLHDVAENAIGCTCHFNQNRSFGRHQRLERIRQHGITTTSHKIGLSVRHVFALPGKLWGRYVSLTVRGTKF